MKKIIKATALILSVILVLSVGLTGCKKEASTAYEITPINVSTSFEALMGTESDWLNYNPDRGYRTEMVVFLYDTAEHNPELLDDPRAICVNDSENDIRKTCDYLMRLYLLPENKLTISYIFFQD